MKRHVANALRTGVPFGLVMGLLNGSTRDEVLAIGIANAAAFGIAMAFVFARAERAWAKLREPYDAEGVLLHGPASCAIGPGYLVLTQRRLVWLPRKDSQREKRIEIPLAELASIRVPAALMRNRLEVTVRTGEKVRFLVRGPREWETRLQAPRAIVHSAAR